MSSDVDEPCEANREHQDPSHKIQTMSSGEFWRIVGKSYPDASINAAQAANKIGKRAKNTANRHGESMRATAIIATCQVK